MAVIISDMCICCGACIDECPVEAISTDWDNPISDDLYYVDPNKCVECVSFNDEPACAESCPTEGCINWSDIINGQPFKDDISLEMRKGDTACVS